MQPPADTDDLARIALESAPPPLTWKERLGRVSIGVIAGGLLGLGLYTLVGCRTGCVITSSPILTSIYGALVGGVAAFR